MPQIKVGDLVRIKDGFDRDPLCLDGYALYLGEYGKSPGVSGHCVYTVWYEGRVQVYDEPYWALEKVAKKNN
tara:strand:+ start:8960 stop:9175 length:216 start_codon:yes stop_codon:yes gene_type:complete